MPGYGYPTNTTSGPGQYFNSLTMNIKFVDSKVMIIITSEEVIDAGKKKDVNITRSEAIEILERMFIGSVMDEDFVPMMENIIEDAVHWETNTEDVFWDDPQEKQDCIDSKILTYKGLVYNHKTKTFKKRQDEII